MSKVTLQELRNASNCVVREYAPGEVTPIGVVTRCTLLLDAEIAFFGRSRAQARRNALRWLQRGAENGQQEKVP